MNMNEKDIDHLTRKLMRGTAEQPSASLNSRIMALIIQEKKRVYKYYIKKRFTPVGIFSIFVAYMLVLVGILYLVKLSPGGAETVLGSLRAYFPIVLTIASGISCFFLFTQLDNWLKREEIRRQRNAVYFLAGYEISDLEKIMDCISRNRERTWLKGCRWKSTYHRRTD